MGLEELVRRIRMGDKTAVKDLISIYGNAVYLRAFERTQDKELAREAARQTFGQFVAVVQQQPDEDGWSLWFGDLIERNISAYVQIAPDMSLIEDELERELYGEPEALPEHTAYAQPAARVAQPPEPQRQSSGRVVSAPEPADKASRSSGRSIRDEVFSESYRPHKKKKRGGGALSIILLILVCLILLWVVGGVAMTMKWIPEYDLGYTWFNLNVFKLF